MRGGGGRVELLKFKIMKYYKSDKHMLRRFLRLHTSFPSFVIRRMSYKKMNSIYMFINPNLKKLLYDNTTVI